MTSSRRRRDTNSLQIASVWLVLLLLVLPSAASSSFSSRSNLSFRRRQPQQQGRTISHLPGFEGPLPFQFETGYVEVDDSNGARLFYYFVRSEGSPAEDPVLLWMPGGPGCSGFSSLVYQIGPLGFDLHANVDGLPKLLYRPESWTKSCNIIFLDSPVGSGFSYIEAEPGYKSSDTIVVNQTFIFLKKWFTEHPEFLSNPLYVGGDSYSGMIMPALALEIAKVKEDGAASALNLKGYILGNPVTDAKFDSPSRIPFAHGMGLISDEMYQTYKESCSAEEDGHESLQCKNRQDAIDECVKDLCQANILEPCRNRVMLHLRGYTAWASHPLSGISTEPRDIAYELSNIWANNDRVIDALGIHKVIDSSCATFFLKRGNLRLCIN